MKAELVKKINFLRDLFSTQKAILGIVLFCSAVALISAYVSEYVFGYKPCILCLYQRIPFAIVMVVSLLVFFVQNQKIKNIAILCCAVLFFVNGVLAGFHSGVEMKVFSLKSECTSGAGNWQLKSLEELKEELSTQVVRCDEPSLFLLGLSMASWNALYCFFLTFLVIFLYTNKRNTRENH